VLLIVIVAEPEPHRATPYAPLSATVQLESSTFVLEPFCQSPLTVWPVTRQLSSTSNPPPSAPQPLLLAMITHRRSVNVVLIVLTALQSAPEMIVKPSTMAPVTPLA